MNWVEAEQACLAYGGHLASLADEDENIFFGSVASCCLNIFAISLRYYCNMIAILSLYMIENILGRWRTAPTSGLVGSPENPTSGLGPMIRSGFTMSGRWDWKALNKV